jgi:signal peptidase I
MNKAIIKEIVETVVFVIVALIIIRFFLGEVRWIPSASMHPTLVEGD